MKVEPVDVLQLAPEASHAKPALTIITATYSEWVTRKTLWRPPTDVMESPEMITVRIEAAGMQGGEFSISVQPNLLAVRGVRLIGNPRGAYRQMEINTGEFISLVELFAPVDIDHVAAEYNDGFLIIQLPKHEPAAG
ncbi:MAG: Hsp20/alpha crystallin family protein [Chloroflexi bacterium]|nr:Hsp20/alpha crystallin family protein [Chloroflexota bacterium]